jgi:hypothetical protein
MDMIRGIGLASAMEALPETLFAETVCLPILQKGQNRDGGWGFHVGGQSRVEPTCWALQALVDSSHRDLAEPVARGFQFLRAAQLADGSWPVSSQQKTGCWVTSLASWTLLGEKDSSAGAVSAGLKWLCADWPKDSTLWLRVLKKFSTQQVVCPINNAYRGWGWTARTSSWVEPTSLALLALDQMSKEVLPSSAAHRRKLAESMLYDRMCPGGGWNCGNPMVYGTPGEPLVGPTSWALLALRYYPRRDENIASLDWLEKTMQSVQSGASLALAKICLETYGRKPAVEPSRLQEIYLSNHFLGNVQTAAWTCLAFSKRKRWLVNSTANSC